MPHSDAVMEIVQCSGTQFDPEIVRIFSQAHSVVEEIYERYAIMTNEALHNSVWGKLNQTRWAPY